MTTGQTIALVITLAALVLYPVVMRILVDRVQPTRLRMADLGKQLLASTHLPDRLKDVVDGMLDEAFDWRFMLFASFLFPYFVIGRMFRLIAPPKIPKINDLETRKQFHEFLNCHTRATAAANPLFAIILGIEVALLVVVLVPLGMMWHASDMLFEATIKTDRHLKHS